MTLAGRLADDVGPVVFPLHPRTRARLVAAGSMPSLERANVRVLPPIAWEEMLDLVASSRVVVTDSGGLQEEASFFGVPVVVLRTSTPRWEGVEAGTSVLTGLDAERAAAAAARAGRAGRASAGSRCAMSLRRRAGVGAHRADPGRPRDGGPPHDFRTRAPVRSAALVIELRGVNVGGALVDLDDTLFPQASWLRGAWRAAANAAAPTVDARALEDALHAVASEGSDRGRIIDRALALVTTEDVGVDVLVAAFRAYRAPALDCYAGARHALQLLRSRVPVALVTDGDPSIQRGKLESLGLTDAFDAVVCSDELARGLRKPHPAPFLAAATAIGMPPGACVMIGDRPDKDVAGAHAAGLVGTVRVRTGEYAHVPVGTHLRDHTLAEVESFADAVARLRELVPAPDAGGRDGNREQAEDRPARPTFTALR